jgi:uncharacterized protein YjbI with pentapeptide repeats
MFNLGNSQETGTVDLRITTRRVSYQHHAPFTDASLQNAKLDGAIMKDAILDRADLSGIDLMGTVNLSWAQVRTAINYQKAKLPRHIAKEVEKEQQISKTV